MLFTFMKIIYIFLQYIFKQLIWLIIIISLLRDVVL